MSSLLTERHENLSKAFRRLMDDVLKFKKLNSGLILREKTKREIKTLAERINQKLTSSFTGSGGLRKKVAEILDIDVEQIEKTRGK